MRSASRFRETGKERSQCVVCGTNDPGPLQVLADVHAQLAHAATRMIDPCRHDELYDQGLVDGFALADLALLVIGLARMTESPADGHNLHAHRFWEILRHGVCDVIPTAFFL